MEKAKLQRAFECAQKTREYLIKKYGRADFLDGKCKEAADLMIKALKSQGINASKHFGWCIYDNCEHSTDKPCSPHCYVLIHDGAKRLYLDCTATQFQFALDEPVPEVILLPAGKRPYWFRTREPSVREMENTSDWY